MLLGGNVGRIFECITLVTVDIGNLACMIN